MRLWKWLGLAGVAGVAATGVVVARNQRRRAAMSPDDVRRRLHQRVADLDRAGGSAGDSAGDSAGAPQAGPDEASDRA